MIYANLVIENLLQQYQLLLGKDFEKYRNHVYRVFLNCVLIDQEKNNEEKYAIAAVFHDIGIWTNQTIDYLDPSAEQVRRYLNKRDHQERIDEIVLMIKWHHKITRYQGMHAEITETFRKADWIDVSFGLINFGIDRKKIRNNRCQFANLGFHFFLVKKITRNFFRHPLNPLPMFKR